MNNATILPCSADQIRFVADIEKATFSDPWTEDSLKGMICGGYYTILCAIDTDGVCGYVIASSIAGESEILRIAVSPDHRRRGIGAALLDRFIKDRALAGDREFFLEVRASNTPAISLYVSHGFEVCGTRKNYYKSPTEDATLMRLTMSSDGN
ncbi:MAG: ribosomal protein S18-alanine N-acetyltransferase [Clostridia bacterium]|nr:ribosomal protein S18-alanine N-acetyltransferase [Clostridia bacterium]